MGSNYYCSSFNSIGLNIDLVVPHKENTFELILEWTFASADTYYYSLGFREFQFSTAQVRNPIITKKIKKRIYKKKSILILKIKKITITKRKKSIFKKIIYLLFF
jgi:hypothetical protein